MVYLIISVPVCLCVRYYACLCGHTELVEYLLEAGARCEANTFDGERCLYGALTDDIRRVLLRRHAVTRQTMRRDVYQEFLRRLAVVQWRYLVEVSGESLCWLACDCDLCGRWPHEPCSPEDLLSQVTGEMLFNTHKVEQ